MRTKAVIWVLVALLLAAGLVALVSDRLWGTTASAAPSGFIVLSSVTSESLPFLDAYVLNVQNGNLIMQEHSSVSQENMYSLSPNRAFIAFMGTTRPLVDKMIAAGTRGDPMQVYAAGFDQKTGALPSVSQARQLTYSVAEHKELPVVSNDGMILYVGSPINQTATSSHSTADYTIRLLTGTSSSRSIPGMYPQWYGSNLFYYIASDGVRLYDIAQATSTLVIAKKGQSNFKLAVSHDGTMLAFLNPDAHTVFIYSLSANGLQLTPIKQISVGGYWAVFSPDDAYIAVQDVGAGGTPEILIYDTKDFAQIGAPIDLSQLLNDRLFVTGWLP